MKKIIRLSEQDLVRIVTRVVTEEQINESKKLKALTLGLGLALNIGLSSCDNKTEVKSRIPELEVLVKDQFTKANKTFKSFSQKFDTNPDIDGYTDKVKFQKITKVQEFPSKSLKKWFVVISVKQRIDDEVFDGYVINVYEEDTDGEGRFRASSLSMSQPPFTLSEVNKRIKYYEKNEEWNFSSEPPR